MNINQLVWNKNIPFSDRLSQLTIRRDEIKTQITNYKKIPFDIYYKFSTASENLTINNEWKELDLAIKVLKIIKRWDRLYQIDLRKKLSGQMFIDYFKDYIDTSKFNLCTIGINFYSRETYTLKTMILWANKLCKLDVIGNIQFNSFMKLLEEVSQ